MTPVTILHSSANLLVTVDRTKGHSVRVALLLRCEAPGHYLRDDDGSSIVEVPLQEPEHTREIDFLLGILFCRQAAAEERVGAAAKLLALQRQPFYCESCQRGGHVEPLEFPEGT